MFEIEKYKKPTDWSQVAIWIVSVIAIVVVVDCNSIGEEMDG